MSKMNQLSSLLTGFYSGRLSTREKSDLYQLIMNDNHQEEIMHWLQEEWVKDLHQTEDVSAGEEMYAKIKSEIKKRATDNQSPVIIKNGPIPKGSDQKSNFFVIVQKRFIPYAAIFALAFTISWVLQKKMTTPDESVMVAEAPLQYNEIVVPYGSKSKVTLSDNSVVWLNAGARFRYPEHFNNNQREVFLQGEGFFDVSHNVRHPFIVNGNGINIKVHGTKFNLMVNADDNIIETTLVEGAIEIVGLKVADKQSNMMMKPGQKLTLHKVNDQYQVQNILEAGLLIPKEAITPARIESANLFEKANIETATAWTANKLVFSKERFSDVKTKLERWYGVTIEVKDKEILDYSFTGTFEKQTFEQAMNALSKAASCKFEIVKNQVIVSK